MATAKEDRDNEPSEFGGRRGQPRGAGTSASDRYMAERQQIKADDARVAAIERRKREARQRQ